MASSQPQARPAVGVQADPGILQEDPGIFRQICTQKKITTNELFDFLTDLFDAYKEANDAGTALARLKEVWSYTAALIADQKERSRIFKSMIKSRNESEYRDALLVARGKIRL